MENEKNYAAFTLIELLVVIAIIAILALVVFLTINPAELLRQSRDANRLSDEVTLQSALNIYVTDQGGSSNFSLGSTTVTYVSIPDPSATSTAGTDCSGLAGSNFAPGGTFHCPASSTYRNVNGTGWIPVNFTGISAGSPIGSLPVDPLNTTSSNDYYTYQPNTMTFRIASIPESQKDTAIAGINPNSFIAGSDPLFDGGYWVLVPGNSILGTNNFYAMKYEAGCAIMSTGAALTTPTSVYGGYVDNNSSSTNCTPSNGFAPAATPTALSIIYLTQSTAASYCAEIGAHLMTNTEWQTIAWNAENVASNWSGGSVGSGYVYSGHNDDVPGQISLPSPNDSLGYTGTDGPTSGGGTGGGGSAANNQLRTLTLSDGTVIWDMGGNLSQWVNGTTTGTNEPNSGASGFNWIELSSVTTWGGMSQHAVGPSNASWNSSQGLGKLYAEYANDSSVYTYNRGGDWHYAANAGVNELELDRSITYTNNNTGFRCTR